MGCSSSKVAPELPFTYSDGGDNKGPLVSVEEKKRKRDSQNTEMSSDNPQHEPIRQRALKSLNSAVERDLFREDNRPIQKALFLGTGESGKSTVFKQMRLCYGDSYDDFERQQYSKLIWADTLRAIRILVDICDEERRAEEGNTDLKALVTSWLGAKEGTNEQAKSDVLSCDPNGLVGSIQIIQSLDLSRQAFLEDESDANARAFLHVHVSSNGKLRKPNEEDQLLLSDEAIEREAIEQGYIRPVQPTLSRVVNGVNIQNDFQEASMRRETEIDITPTRAAIGDAVFRLWETCPEPIKRMVSANQLGLETNAAFFLNKVQSLKADNYLAENDDILHARIKTTGITTAEFNVKSNNLLVMDVGGQRVERKKWIHSFDDVSCLLFVASVSEYDQGLEENESVNRLDEALEVFQQTVNSQWFRSKSVQLFLNKIDILKIKCEYSSFQSHFPGYKGSDTDPDAIMDYIEFLFRERFRAGNRNLYVHRTCATDTTTMKFVIDAVSDMILFENMKWAGMV